MWILYVTIGLLLALIVWQIVFTVTSSNKSKDFISKANSLTIGMSKTEALSIMGFPPTMVNENSQELQLGWEKTQRSGSFGWKSTRRSVHVIIVNDVISSFDKQGMDEPTICLL